MGQAWSGIDTPQNNGDVYLYIMKRTQLYLDESLWNALHREARREKTTISELVRRAARERYMNRLEERAQAMRAIVGMWKDRPEFADSEAYIRELRHDTRLERLENQ
ncbi:MAG TPA: CopG family transcriptional regulator [Acidobacteriaceae bacterium]|nr:CopG family transcriptional regulator [Acidobacteriaceae bacterium]